jgi:hypothetical protein
MMPGCILQVSGTNFNVDGFLASSSLKPYWVWRLGEQVAPVGPRSHRRHETSGFRCDVSLVDGELPGQIDDALAFSKRYRSGLESLANDPTVEQRYLDFGYDCQLKEGDVVVHCEVLPWEFLQLMGELRINVWLSLYSHTKADGDAE